MSYTDGMARTTFSLSASAEPAKAITLSSMATHSSKEASFFMVFSLQIITANAALIDNIVSTKAANDL